MLDPVDRTFICSVVFLDIVGYSKEPVSQQMNWKVQLNKLISSSLQDLSEEQRILLDTGDGAALCFLGDPETALIASMRLVDGLLNGKDAISSELLVRIGINLGAVKVVKDLNGQPNIVGDGINVAQRVMSFAESNQILTSRSFYEVVSCLTREYQRLFVPRGVHKDKHSREHEVYELRPKGSAQPAPTATPQPEPAPQISAPAAIPTPPVNAPQPSAAQVALLQPTVPQATPQPVSAPAPSPGVPFCATGPILAISPAVLDPLGKMLTNSIGPMATIVLKRAVNSAPSFRELCRILSEQIPSPAERSAFLKQANLLLPSEDSAPSPAPAATPPSSAPTPATANPAATIPANTKPSAPTADRRKELTAIVVDGIESEFVKSLGPMAKIILKRELFLAVSPADLGERLSTHIENAKERQSFLGAIKKYTR